MSKTAAVAQSPVTPAAQAKPVAPTLRAVQVRKLSPERFKPVGHFTDPYQAMLPSEWDFEDVLNPDFWGFVAPSMQANVASGNLHDRLGTVVEILTKDHTLFAQVYITGLRRNSQGQADGAYVVCIGPAIDPETGKACPVDLKTGQVWKSRKAAKAA